ncbi:hypothetical protein BH23ACT9_BH23ACT9_38360 [soil metagenome]
MPKKRKQRKGGGRRPPPRRRASQTPHQHEPAAGSGEPDLIFDVRELVREPHPLGLLAFACSLLAAVDPEHQDPFPRARDEPRVGPDLRELVESFLGVPIPETTALLAVIAELVADDLLGQRIRREVAARDHPLPDWLAGLAPLQVLGAREMVHVLGDGDSLALDLRTGSGAPLTLVAYVDHNLGTVVKDAFALPAGDDAAIATFLDAAGADPDLEVRDLDLADARARLEDADATWAMTYPRLETDTWPACRPLLSWVLRHLPPGGTAYERPEWDEADREALAERFFDSPFGRNHHEEDERQLLDSVLWFGCDYGPGDPLRWSPVAVEIILLDWLPRKVVADVAFLARAPGLLRSFVRFSHAERGIREALTRETLDAVDRHEAEYQRTIRSPRPQGPAALLAAMGVLGGDEDVCFGGMLPDYGQMRLERLRDQVGGAEALAALDTDPLPDEPLDLARVAGDIRPRVTEVAGLTDGACNGLLDVECRTACRRLLADVAAAEPDIFRRRGRTDTAAAAIVWVVARVNEELSAHTGGLTAKAVGAWFGVTNPSQRAATMLKALDVPDTSSYSLCLGTPCYLTSAYRRALVETRDQYAVAGG